MEGKRKKARDEEEQALHKSHADDAGSSSWPTKLNRAEATDARPRRRAEDEKRKKWIRPRR